MVDGVSSSGFIFPHQPSLKNRLIVEIIDKTKLEMKKFTNEELLDVLPPSLRESKELTTKQKVVLGQLVIYSGLKVVEKDGYFYRSNKDLCSDCDIQEKTLITAVNRLVMLGFIERKCGSRKDGASLYRLNQKLIADYCRKSVDDNCKKEIDDNSNDYSKLITAMHVRITELEITVKRLVEMITVIEGGNYSTDTDKESDIEIEKDILNNNILNKDSSLNNIEETESRKELEIDESKKNDIESELKIAESPSEVETSNEEQTFIPTAKDKEELKRWNELINPYLLKVQSATSNAELSTIQSKLIQAVNGQYDEWGYPNESVSTYLNERISDYFTSRVKDIESMHSEQINKQLEQLSQYASFYC